MALDVKKLIELLGDRDESIHRQILTSMEDEDKLLAVQTIGLRYEPRFVIDADNKSCYLNLVKWLVCDRTMVCLNPITKAKTPGVLSKGIYLFGQTGTGKSLAIRIISDLAGVLGLKYQQCGRQANLIWPIYRTDEIVDMYIHGNSLTDIKREPIVCFHDLGSEPTEALYMGTRMNVMRNILEQRADNKATLTIITSNYPPHSDEIKKLYGDRVESRLCDMTNLLVLKGSDRRKK